jgi:hypothetical protein
MAKFETNLKSTLYRITCPDSLELGDYYLGLLPKNKATEIRQHLDECPHCTRELNLLESYLKDLASELDYSLEERVMIWIARLIPQPSGELSPALGLRGERGKTLHYQAGDAQLTLEAQDGLYGRKTLFGLLLGVDPAGFQAHLWQAGEKLAQVEVDELGNFVLESIQPGTYELIISGPKTEIYIQDVKVNGDSQRESH